MRAESCWRIAGLSALLALWHPHACGEPAHERPLVVASKAFTESVILGEIITGMLKAHGLSAHHRRELGGTRVLWNGLQKGELDIYPEYTGTLLREILADEPTASADTLAALLERRGVGIAAALGFNNSYVLGMRADEARALGIERISDLIAHPGLRFGLSSEFMSRADGWPGLRAAYRLPQEDVRAMHHDLAYRGIESGAIDVVDLYSTDAEIQYYGLTGLVDDRRFFPRYDAVVLYRLELSPDALAVLRQLEGVIDEATMVALNAATKIERLAESEAAAGFLEDRLGHVVELESKSRARRILEHTVEHLGLVAVSLLAAILSAIPLGVLAVLRPGLGKVMLGGAGLIQTIPALALLVFMIPVLGIGAGPAIAALFLYSLLPIIRNTHSGLLDVPAHVRESALALGLPTLARLRLVELPLAARSIVAGIKTAAVINVGTATLGALIGAGGYGEPILTGIRLDDMALILEGAVPAAALALLVQGAFELAERRWVRWDEAAP